MEPLDFTGPPEYPLVVGAGTPDRCVRWVMGGQCIADETRPLSLLSESERLLFERFAARDSAIPRLPERSFSGSLSTLGIL